MDPFKDWRINPLTGVRIQNPGPERITYFAHLFMFSSYLGRKKQIYSRGILLCKSTVESKAGTAL